RRPGPGQACAVTRRAHRRSVPRMARHERSRPRVYARRGHRLTGDAAPPPRHLGLSQRCLELDAVIPAFEEVLIQPDWATTQLRDLAAGIFRDRLAPLGEQVRMRDLHAALIDSVDQRLGETAMTTRAAGVLFMGAAGTWVC